MIEAEPYAAVRLKVTINNSSDGAMKAVANTGAQLPERDEIPSYFDGARSAFQLFLQGANMSDFRGYDLSRTGGITTTQARNKVLRNTYLLLALSMIPTVLGAWIGVAAGFTTLMAASPGASFMTFLLVAFGFM